ncbi:MAG: nucleotidyltransferase domain-containing protein [Bryobacteraceae bacterium]|jgi:hypothetical protein
MLRNLKEDYLSSLLFRRLSKCPHRTVQFVRTAAEVIVFGSTAAGLHRPDSDLDVLCVGIQNARFKNQSLDLVCLSQPIARSSAWLHSELAYHVVRYGVWLTGTPWSYELSAGLSAVRRKERRLRSFLSHLPEAWEGLDEAFKVKYAMKLRRETQRFLLLQRGLAIPPTLVLDDIWRHSTATRSPVLGCLTARISDSGGVMAEGLFARMEQPSSISESTPDPLVDRLEFREIERALQGP